jgi:hypothetical protein
MATRVRRIQTSGRAFVAPSARVVLLKRVLLSTIALLAITFALLAVIEGATSVGLLAKDIAAIKPAGNFRKAAYDSLVGWVGIPNLSDPNNFGPGLSLTHNADGMRIHRPVTPALAPGEKRAICSGDSFTYGSGVADSQTFCAYLEQQLPGVRTLNMAQQGFGIDQAYLWYKRDAGKYPHQVHLFAFIWNDFERMALRSFWGYKKPILTLKDSQLVIGNVPVPKWTGSTRWSQASMSMPQLRTLQLVERQVDMSEGAQLERIDAQVLDVAEAVFRDLDRVNHARGSQLVLVYLPTVSDLDKGPYDKRRAKLAKFSKESGIPLIDLATDIRTVDKDSVDWLFITPRELTVRGSGGHYTSRGHRWVAAQLAAHLREMSPSSSALALNAR